MNTDKISAAETAGKPIPDRQPVDWKKEHNQKKFYDPITFKEIKIGYTGDLMDDENTPF